MEKVFGEFQALSCFPRKIVFYSSTKIGILKPGTYIQSLRSFDLGLLQTPKQIYRKLQYKEKVFGEFQALPRFPRKNGFVLVDQIWLSKVLNKYSISQKIWFLSAFDRL